MPQGDAYIKGQAEYYFFKVFYMESWNVTCLGAHGWQVYSYPHIKDEDIMKKIMHACVTTLMHFPLKLSIHRASHVG